MIYNMLHPEGLPEPLSNMPITVRLGSLGLSTVLPIIIITIVGVFAIDKLQKGKKLLFIIWLILFLIWLYWLLILTRFCPMPIPL